MNIKLVKTIHPVQIGGGLTTSLAFHKDSKEHVKRQKLLGMKWVAMEPGFEGVAVSNATNDKTILIPESNIAYFMLADKDITETVLQDTGVVKKISKAAMEAELATVKEAEDMSALKSSPPPQAIAVAEKKAPQPRIKVEEKKTTRRRKKSTRNK